MSHRDDELLMNPRFRALRALYEAFNARDIDTVIAAMSANVEWPNGWEGGQLKGPEAVRDYWVRQWVDLRLFLTPLRYRELSDGRIEVSVKQVARDPGGYVLAREEVRHVYEFDRGLVCRMRTERQASSHTAEGKNLQ